MLKKITLFMIVMSFTVAAVFAAPAALPESDQKTSYAAGDDGGLQMDVKPASPRFKDNRDGTVTDNLTGVVWLKNANCTFGGTQNPRTWPDALAAANELKSGDCGLTDGSKAGDWRLPYVGELERLVNTRYNEVKCTATSNCTSNAEWLNNNSNSTQTPQGIFSNVQARHYWSSTTYAGYMTFAWSVDMHNGYVELNGKKNYSLYVWPVRAGMNR